MRGRVLIFELHRVFEPKRGSISKCTTLLLIRRFAPPSPQGEGFWRTFPHCCIQIYIAVPRGRGKPLPYITTMWENPGGRTTVSLRRPRHQKAGRSGERPAFWYRRRESNPYGAMPGDFKSPVSTCSTTPAYLCILPFLAACVKWRTEKTPAVRFGRRADLQIAQALR